MKEKIQLYGFNNLTKTLSFNIYDISYAKTDREKKDYIAYIDEQYNSERLTGILCEVTDIIGACVLNISKQDYDPQGASVTVMISEEHVPPDMMDISCNQGLLARELIGGRNTLIAAHLDKSHVTVHTYPEFHPNKDISSFRVDIDVSTCGKVTPLAALDYLIGSFDSDIITMDYRIRGFTRDVDGKKYYKDHDINSIQNYISRDMMARYDAIDINVYQSNIFHTKMILKEIALADYLFNVDPRELSPETRLSIKDEITKEMLEIYYGTNIY
ncbi:MAG: adenosylmethionine decarboxylase [Synergistaceae bacterium]|nr:adenosylmethionine decarboxylase [Synergistaceae bacterium]